MSFQTRAVRHGLFVTALMCASAMYPALGLARQADDPASTAPAEQGSGDIVVTAQKRQERLQDVPLAVTALSGDMLAARQINDTNGLVKAVASLNYQQGNNPTNTTFRIRGVGTSLFSQGVESSVSVVVDGVVAARQAQNFSDFADIERVEVLRGPQGTLFGKNATAGVINVVTARPSDHYEAQGSATIAEDNEYRVNGTVSGPITDRLRARLTGYYNDIGGYIDNVHIGTAANGQKSWGVRGKLEWDATDTLNLLLAADYRKSDANCCNSELVEVNNPLRATLNGGATVAADTRQVSNDDATFADSTQKTVSLEANLNLGFATLTSLTAYQDFDLENNYEVDRIGYADPVFITGTSTAQQNYNWGRTQVKQFSQELRLASKPGGRLNYVGGVYYAHLDLDRDFRRRRAVCATGTFGEACTPTSYQSLGSHAVNKSDSVSAFGQVDYALIDHLKAIGGARLQYEKVSIAGQRTGVLVAGDATFGGAASAWAGQSAHDTALTGKAGLQYEFSRRAQIYATYTRGYKGLGYDTEITADFGGQKAVKPEWVNAYEVGFKGQSADGRFSVAAAAFWADYTNLQIQANASDPVTNVVSYYQTNAGSARTRGLELEATARPVSWFSLNGSATYTESSVDVDGLNCPTQYQSAAQTYGVGADTPVNTCYKYQYVNAAGATVTSGAVQDVRNGKLPVAPSWRVNVSPRVDFGFHDGWNGFVQVDYRYTSKQNFAIEQDPLQTQKAYSTVDLSLGFRAPQSRYSVTFFVKNLFDQNYYTSKGTSTLFPSNTTTLDIWAFRPKDADRYVGLTIAAKI